MGGRLFAWVGLPTAVVAVTVLVIGAAAYGGYRLFGPQPCGDRTRLAVTVTPELAPAVKDTVRTWTATNPRVEGKCVAVEVLTANSPDVAAAIAGQHQTTLAGLGQAAGDIRVPDVWIPDSTSWILRLRTGGADWVPDLTPSVARSPVVLAMPEPLAATLGWPTKKLTWAELLPALTANPKLHPGIVDPTRDSAGASGLLALAAAAQAAGAQARQTTVIALRALAAGRSALSSDLVARFPRAADAGSIASALAAAPLSEQAVIAQNAAQPAVPLAAVYAVPAPVPLDYPYTVLPGATRDKAAVARAVQVTLSGDAFRNRLAQDGLRAADGSAGDGFATPKGATTAATPATPAPDPAVLGKLLSTWTSLLAPGRMLTVIDVSGSMARPVPAAGGVTRDQVAVEAAKRGLALLDDTWAVGLWIFSTQLDSGKDWKEIVPLGVLSSQRQAITAGLAQVVPKTVNGGTGLYNTVLAAYKNVQVNWDPGRVNSVLIMTDGKNEDAPGLTLDQLVDQLKAAQDPARPVEVIAMGLGDQVSAPELRRITDTTGGATFLAPDPSKIPEIFFQALGLRPSAPR
ncbi:MAG: hypothetical protein QOI74_3245 [Micromonosporaceae bacterium]|jgi:hypothetical protein|nr:hypothetical protein [Micromonosporaceae bacterium]MDT5035942.1 hypothetical protein [Micromonosporaceae bacterium]